MPSPNERRRNNIRTGIFVSITLIVALAVIVVLTDVTKQLSRTTQMYTVVYDVSAGVKNLKSGADVRVGGVSMGEVVEVAPLFAEDQAFTQIQVQFNVDDHVKLYQDARIFVTAPLIGSDAWLDIPSVGTPAAGEPVNGIITGAETVGLLNAVLGPESAARTEHIVENAEVFSQFLATVPQKYDDDFYPILENVHDVTSRINNEDWPRWADKVDQVMDWAVAFTDDLDAAVAEGHGLLTDARGVVDENRQRVGEIVDNVGYASEDVKELAAHTNSETIAKVDSLLTRGQEGLDSAIKTIATIQEDYEGWATDIGGALGNANLASQQLKLALIEVRRSPWKVLYRPTEDELEHELLYEATRSFAAAAVELKAAAEFTDRLLDNHGKRLEQDGDLVKRLNQILTEPLDRYQQAQDRLFEVLIDSGP